MFPFFLPPGLRVVGRRGPQHPEASRPLAALQELRDAAPVAPRHRRRVGRGGSRRSAGELRRPGFPQEARCISARRRKGVCAFPLLPFQACGRNSRFVRNLIFSPSSLKLDGPLAV